MERLSDFAADIINDLYENSDWYGDYSLIEAAINRLAAYEDTRLEPEEIISAMDMAKIACALHELNAYKELGPIDRLRKLAQADRDGRCVVLPTGEHADKDGENALKSAMNTCFYHNNPVTRYIADAVAEKLTREEAEKALEAMKNG